MHRLKSVSKQLGALMLFFSLAMLFSGGGWALYEYLSIPALERSGLEEMIAFGLSALVGILLGGVSFFLGRHNNEDLDHRSALLLVSLTWFVGSALSALPFWFWAQNHLFAPGQDQAFSSFVNCYFEAMSGLTTTGATILSNIQSIPRSLIFWRAFTHWLGGLGIVVLFVAVLPFLAGSGGTKRVYGAESSGVSSDTMGTNLRDNARTLLLIYLLFTLGQILLFRLVDPDISLFKAMVHAFSCLSTGGFSDMNESAAGLSLGVQWLMVGFMILAGVNFANYQALFRGKFRQVWQDPELRTYLAVIAIATLMIVWSLWDVNYHSSTGELASKDAATNILNSAFQASAIHTGTGFVTADFNEWPIFAKTILVGLMFFGGCVGSTAGGIKVIRVITTIKILLFQFEMAFRPNVMRPIRVGSTNLSYQQRIGVLAYVIAIIFITLISGTLLMITEESRSIDATTAMTAVIATINNVGPGLGGVGAIGNYAFFSDFGKIFMSILMALGRLELFAVIVIFLPGFWRNR